MTTAIATIQRTGTKGGLGRAARRFGEALAALGGWIADGSARYHATGIGTELEGLPANERIDAALRWHARHGRVL